MHCPARTWPASDGHGLSAEGGYLVKRKKRSQVYLEKSEGEACVGRGGKATSRERRTVDNSGAGIGGTLGGFRLFSRLEGRESVELGLVL